MAKAKKIIVTIVDENGQEQTSTITAGRNLVEYNQTYQFGIGIFRLRADKVKVKFS